MGRIWTQYRHNTDTTNLLAHEDYGLHSPILRFINEEGMDRANGEDGHRHREMRARQQAHCLPPGNALSPMSMRSWRMPLHAEQHEPSCD